MTNRIFTSITVLTTLASMGFGAVGARADEQILKSSVDAQFLIPNGAQMSSVEFAEALNKVIFSTFQPSQVLEGGSCALGVTELKPLEQNDMYVFSSLSCEIYSWSGSLESLTFEKMQEILRTLSTRSGVEIETSFIVPQPGMGISN